MTFIEQFLRRCFVRPEFEGYRPGLPMQAYSDFPALNASVLKQKTPAEMRHAIEERQLPPHELYAQVAESTAITWATGTACHKAILEPDLFSTDDGWQEYFAYPATTAGITTKASRQQLQAEPDRPLITPEILDVARRVRDAAWAHPLIAAHLKACRKEVSGFAFDGMTAMKIRADAMPDWTKPWPITSTRQWPLDLKTTTLLDYHKFRYQAKRQGYHIQSAVYLDTDKLIRNLAAPEDGFYIAVLTKEPPFMARLVEVTIGTPEQTLEEGYRIAGVNIGRFNDCATREIEWYDRHPGKAPSWRDLRAIWEGHEHQAQAEPIAA